MKPKLQIIELAKLDGWLDVKEYTHKYGYMGEQGEYKQLQGRSKQNLGHLVGLPKYLESRDTIVPLIEKQNHHIRLKVEDELCKMRLGGYLFLSTPQQLAEALLRACGKWEE